MFKTTLIRSVVLASGIAVGTTGYAQPVTGNVDAAQQTPADAALSTQQATMTQSQMHEAINQTVAKLRTNPNILWVGFGEVSVDVAPSNPAWGKHRTLAYQKSVQQAESKYLKEFGSKAASEKLSSYFSNGEFTAPDFDLTQNGNDSQWSRLFNKLAAATEGKVDKVLDELGIDPEKFAATPVEQRHVEFRDHFQRSITIESFGNLSGMVTYKTFEGLNEHGDYRIASVLVVSEKMKQLSHEILHSQGDLKASPDSKGVGSLEKLNDRDADRLVYDFGVRRLYDAEGYPALISFGQWSVSYTGNNPRKRSRLFDHAYKQAEAQANADLIEFLKSSATFSSSSDTKSLIEEATSVNQDNFKRDDSIESLTDIVRESATKKSKVSIVGLSELRRWSKPHPDNPEVEIVGVIRYWSPVNEQKMRKVANWKPAQKQTTTVAAAKEPAKSSMKTGIKSSDEMMDASDF